MDENKGLLLDENATEEQSVDTKITLEEIGDSIPQNAAEIAGQINELVVYMMDNSLLEADTNEFANRVAYLFECYSVGYRHSYYNVSATIYSHWNENHKQFDNLVTWMEILKEIIEEHRGDLGENVTKSVNKFYDHIMLEIVRMTDHQKKVDNINQIIESFRTENEKAFGNQELSLQQTVAEFENKFGEAEVKIGNASTKISEIEKNVEKISEKANKAKKKVKDVYSQFVSILGIFSAIVIVFFGGTSVFTSMLTNIHEAEWYEIGMGASAVGLILFDIIFMFLYILSKYLEVPIGTKENSDKKNMIFKWIDKYPYVFLFNFFCILVFVVCA